MCNAHIGQHIKRYREGSQMSQLDLAVELGVEQSNISHYETGKRSPDIKMLVRIADVFGLKLWAFLREINI